MSNLILPYDPPNWIYEGNDPRRVEFNSGSVINRSTRQIHENVLSIKTFLDNHVQEYLDHNVINRIKINNVESDLVIDSIKTLSVLSIKWIICLTYTTGIFRRLSFEILASHDGYTDKIATEVNYNISSITRSRDMNQPVPISITLDDVGSESFMSLWVHTSEPLDLRLVRISVPF